MDSMQDIADYGRDIQSALRQLSEALSNTTSPDESLTIFVERTQQSFLLWAANLGMFDQGHRSLSYRLQAAQDIKEYMAELLEELLYNLNELIPLCTDVLASQSIDLEGERNHDTQSVSSFDSENGSEDCDGNAGRDEILGRIESANDIQHRLFGLAHKIRHPLMRSAPGKRNVYRTIDSADRLMAIKQLVEVEHGRISDYFLQTRRDLQNLPDAQTLGLDSNDKMLIGRLAQANSFRRQQFVFWRETNRERHEIAGQQLFQLMPEESAARPSNHLNVVSLPTRTNPAPTAQSSMPSSVTKLQPGQFDLADRFSVATHDTRAPSAYGPTGEKVGWPGPPSELKPEATGYVVCPYCHNLCPNRYLERGVWKTHLLHDLRPYSCTYPECTTKENMYESYSTWSAHELLEHNGAFKCLEHASSTSGPPEFIELSAYQDHVKQYHPEQASEMLRDEAVIARRGGSSSAKRPCPVCLTQILDSRAMMKHVAGHLEIIALMTLPRSTGLEVGSEGGSARPSMQSAYGTNSRADLDDLSLPGEQEVPRVAHMSNQALTDTQLHKKAEDALRSLAVVDSVEERSSQTQGGQTNAVNNSNSMTEGIIGAVEGGEHIMAVDSHPEDDAGGREDVDDGLGRKPDVSDTAFNLLETSETTAKETQAIEYWHQSRYVESESLFLQAIGEKASLLGSEHPDTLTSIESFSSLYQNQERWAEAEILTRRILNTRMKSLGPSHPDTLESMSGLEYVLEKLNRWTEAEELASEIVNIQTSSIGHDHPDTLSAMSCITRIYLSQGRLGEATAMAEQVLTARIRVLGIEHPDTFSDMSQLVRSLRQAGRFSEAEALRTHIVQAKTKELGTEHPDTEKV